MMSFIIIVSYQTLKWTHHLWLWLGSLFWLANIRSYKLYFIFRDKDYFSCWLQVPNYIFFILDMVSYHNIFFFTILVQSCFWYLAKIWYKGFIEPSKHPISRVLKHTTQNTWMKDIEIGQESYTAYNSNYY